MDVDRTTSDAAILQDTMAVSREVAESQRRKAAFDAELAERVREWTLAEAPLAEDLRAAGLNVSSAWDLVNTSEPYPQALPILMDHLERGGYPDRVMAGIARALAVKPAVTYWQRLRVCYEGAVGPEEKDGIAVALAGSATAAQVDDMVEIVDSGSFGEDAIYFIRPLLRLGKERGVSFVAGLVDDPLLGKEATALLKRRKRP